MNFCKFCGTSPASGEQVCETAEEAVGANCAWLGVDGVAAWSQKLADNNAPAMLKARLIVESHIEHYGMVPHTDLLK